MMRLIRLFASLSLLATPASAVTDKQPDPFAGEIGEFRFRDEIRMPKSCGLLFVGSSSIRLWVGIERDFHNYEVIQRGFGGSQISDTNRHFDQIVARYKPAKIVMYAGENDLNAGEAIDAVYADFLTFLSKKEAALGSTPVYYLAVKPSPSRDAQREMQDALNAKIKELASTRPDLVYLDIVAPMLDDKGIVRGEIFTSDRLHMNQKGYALWLPVIEHALRKEKATKAPGCKASE